MRNVFLSGVPGVGKTTLIRRALEQLVLPDQGVRVAGGFYTEEIRERGRRVGFRIRTLDGKEATLAHVRCQSRFRVGRYGVDVGAFDRVGVQGLRDAMRRPGIIVMDEVGRMELYSKQFQSTVREVLDSPAPVLGVLQRRRSPFLDEIRRRKDVHLIEVTHGNRGALASTLAAMMAKLVRS